MLIWLLLLVAIVLLFVGWQLRKNSCVAEDELGLPLRKARVVYSDTGAWEKLPQVLKSETYGVIGKPDYILRLRNGSVVPVEVKPTRRAATPYTSDIMQLAAYCLLLEDVTGVAPPYGLLRYAEQTFQIDWDDALRDDLLQILDEMRSLQAWPAVRNAPMPPPQHDMTVRCDNCGFHYICWP